VVVLYAMLAATIMSFMITSVLTPYVFVYNLFISCTNRNEHRACDDRSEQPNFTSPVAHHGYIIYIRNILFILWGEGGKLNYV
jgi:hypothetical protein